MSITASVRSVAISSNHAAFTVYFFKYKLDENDVH